MISTLDNTWYGIMAESGEINLVYLWRLLMRKIFCLFCLMACVLVAGCSKSKAVQFCEGVSPDGEGVNCGTVFEDGELTALIRAKEPFGVKTIALQVFEVKGEKIEKTESLYVAVKPERDTASVNLSFYTEGTFRVRAMSGNTAIGEGEIRIVER